MTKQSGRAGVHRRRMLLAGTVGLALVGLAGAAQADPVDISIIDRNTGRPLQIWRHDGRLFVAGQTGAGYCLRVANHTAGRVLAVLSVDGVNIYTGQTAGYGQGGYIYGPYETYDQCGWRKSLDEIAAFTFTPLPDSYAARTGRPAEVGVIGMAIFYEKAPAAAAAPTRPYNRYREAPADVPPPVLQREVPPPPEPGPPPPPPIAVKPLERLVVPPPPPRPVPPPPAPLARSAPAPAEIAEAQRSEKLGTGHGALETSVIQLVSFDRATSAPAFVRQIEYDSYENLVAAGVIPPSEHRPQAFPVQPHAPRFVPDPPPER